MNRRMAGAGGMRRSLRGGGGLLPPVNTVAPVVSGQAYVGETLSSTTGTWNGNPTFAYQWKRDGVNINGATSSTYAAVDADSGTDVTCTVTATNGAGSVSATSNALTIWSPAELANLEAWYRGDQYDGTTWADLSANGHSITQGTAGARPTATTRAGQAALSFGGDDYLQGAFGHSHAQPLTHFVVWEATSTATASQVFFDGDDATNRQFLFLSSTGPSIRAGATSVIIGGAPSANTIYASCFVANGASSALYGLSDFVTASVTGNAGTAAIDGITIGSAYNATGFFTGFIWESISVSGSLSLANRKLVGDYFTARYDGLTVVTS